MRIKIATILVFLIASASAQEYEKVSGYLGKRLLIGFDFKAGPSNEVQTQLDVNSKGTSGLSLNTFLQAKIEYAIGSYKALGVSYTTHSTSAIINEDEYVNGITWGDNVGNSSGPWDFEHRITGITGTPLISDQAIGLYYRKFLVLHGAMAPTGTYFQIGAKVHNYTIDFSNVRYHTTSYAGLDKYETLTFGHKQKIAKVQYGELDFAIGKRVPITKRILIDYSVGGGILTSALGEDVIKSDYRWDSPTEIGVIETRERLARSHFFKSSIGLSFLLF